MGDRVLESLCCLPLNLSATIDNTNTECHDLCHVTLRFYWLFSHVFVRMIPLSEINPSHFCLQDHVFYELPISNFMPKTQNPCIYVHSVVFLNTWRSLCLLFVCLCLIKC